MSQRSDELYQKILELRAERLGVSREEAERVHRSKPLFLLAAEAAAKRLGISPEEVLAADLQRMETSTYPTPECLTPDEVEDLVEAGVESGALDIQVGVGTLSPASGVVPLPEVRLAHLRSCDACRTLLAAVRPEQRRREEFQRFLDAELPRAAAAESSSAAAPSLQAAPQGAAVGRPAPAIAGDAALYQELVRVVGPDEALRLVTFKVDHANFRESYQRELDQAPNINAKMDALSWTVGSLHEGNVVGVPEALEQQRAPAEEDLIRNVIAAHGQAHDFLESGNLEESDKQLKKASRLVEESSLAAPLKEFFRLREMMHRCHILTAVHKFDAARALAEKCRLMVEARRNVNEERDLQTVLAIIEVGQGHYDKAADYLAKADQKSREQAARGPKGPERTRQKVS
ncbi:MAG: hypothetical protein ACRD1B_12060 [Thermoanaerobaculia bacterium]